MPLEPPPWILNTQADIDACAEGLLAEGFATTVWRNLNGETPVRYMEIHSANGRPVIAEIGKVVLVLFGSPQVVTFEQYQNSPFYEGQ